MYTVNSIFDMKIKHFFIPGRTYHNEHGDVWPGQEDPGPGLKNPSPKDAFLVLMSMSIFLAFVKAFFER